MPVMPTPRVPASVVLAVYMTAVFVGATLVFLVQPLAARLLLPRFGGSPAVWTVSILFFQASLLVGYGWAHVTTTRLGLRRQPIAQVLLLLVPLAVLPIALPTWATPPTDTEPSLWVLLVLAAMVGIPYVAVTTASPVLQRWFSGTSHPHAADPYFLYAMGNGGSLIGLLAYPLLIEPNLALHDQAVLWSVGYLLFAGLAVAAAIVLRLATPTETPPSSDGTAAPPPAEEDVRPTVRRRLGWVALAFIPSSLMLGVTTYISTDLAAVPLLWVLPLSLYLMTFMIAFSPRNPLTVPRLAAVLPILVVALAIALIGVVALPLFVVIGLNLVAFFVAALLAHVSPGRRPARPRNLTEFYVLLAVGGALGGLFNALVAPAIFDNILEYPLAITLALLVRPGRPAVGALVERRARFLDLGVTGCRLRRHLALLVALSRFSGWVGRTRGRARGGGRRLPRPRRRPVRFGLTMGGLIMIPLLVGQATIFVDRGFFGVNRIADEDGIRLMIHGTTIHGGQLLDPARAGEPLTYYHRSGTVRTRDAALLVVVRARCGWVSSASVPVGSPPTLVPGTTITYFEIDPVVARIARDPALFTYLSGSPRPGVRVVSVTVV